MAYLTLFLPKISGKFTEKIPTFGEGGVKPVGPKSQLLPKICFGGFPNDTFVVTVHILLSQTIIVVLRLKVHGIPRKKSHCNVSFLDFDNRKHFFQHNCSCGESCI